MSVNFLFVVLFFFASCFIPEPAKQKSGEDPFGKERDQVIYRALNKFIKTMEAKGYRAAGIGEGIDHSTRKQNYLGVTFDIENLPGIEFARKIEVEALQEILRCINEEEGIDNYVAEYPYSVNFLKITFISKIRDKDLCIVSNFENELLYYKDEPGKPLAGPLIEVHRESYEDAVRILNQ